MPAERHHRFAYLYINEGWSGFRALLAAGYRRSVARNPWQLIRKSRPLREAIEEAKRACTWTPKVRPRGRYDRRPTVRVTNSINSLDARRNERGLGRLRVFKQDMRCETCNRVVRADQRFYDDRTGTGKYNCASCAGVSPTRPVRRVGDIPEWISERFGPVVAQGIKDQVEKASEYKQPDCIRCKKAPRSNENKMCRACWSETLQEHGGNVRAASDAWGDVFGW